MSSEMFKFSKGALIITKSYNFLLEVRSQLVSGLWIIYKFTRFYDLKFYNGNFVMVD